MVFCICKAERLLVNCGAFVKHVFVKFWQEISSMQTFHEFDFTCVFLVLSLKMGRCCQYKCRWNCAQGQTPKQSPQQYITSWCLTHICSHTVCPCWENLSVLLLSRLHTEADYLHHSLRGVKSSEGMSLQLPPVAPAGCMRELFILQICPFTFVSTCCAFTWSVCLCAAALQHKRVPD